MFRSPMIPLRVIAIISNILFSLAWIALALHLMTGRHVADSHQCQRPGAPRFQVRQRFRGSPQHRARADGWLLSSAGSGCDCGPFAAWQHCVAADASAL